MRSQMIEEAEPSQAQFGGWQSRNQPPTTISSGDNGKFLREAFSSQAYYDEFCMLLSQVCQQKKISSRGNSSRENSSLNESKIEQKIGLDGRRKRTDAETLLSHRSTPQQLRVTVKLFEEALRSKISLQQKRQFLRNIICQEFANSVKTILDFKKHPQNCTDRFNKNFLPPRSQNNLSLAALENQFSNKTKDCASDYILDIKLLKTCFGHDDGEREEEPGASIYNIVFDKSGRLLFSADEQGLIKMWSKETGLLLHSFRGHTSYIEQLFIAEGNKYLISSGPEGIRIWSLERFECVATFMFDNSVIHANSYHSQHHGLLVFISDSEFLYIIDENTFKKGEGRKIELNTLIRKIRIPKDTEPRVLQISMGSNGCCLIGLDSGQIVLLSKEFLEDPVDFKYIRINEHSKKSLQLSWNKSARSFISCCMDGTCRIWDFTLSCFSQKELKSVGLLRMLRQDRRRKKKSIICNSVAWTCKENYILACFSQVNEPDEEQKVEGEIIIYDYRNKFILHQVRSKLFYKLQAVTMMEPHPVIEEVAMFCQSNGRIVLIDIVKCQLINVFHERCFHLELPHVVIQPIEAKFSPDGTLLAVATEYGNITLYGCGSRSIYFHCPTEQFFRTDKEIFIPNQEMVPISASADIDINLLDRYPMCNVINVPYEFQYKNDLVKLAQENFFSQELIAQPMVPNPNVSDPAWEAVIQKQTQQNQTKEELLKHFYLSLESNGNQELSNQHNHIMNKYREKLDAALVEFNSLSNTLEKQPIKTMETRRLRRNRIQDSDAESYGKEELSERQSASYQQSQEISQVEDEESSESFTNLRRKRRRQIIHSEDEEDSLVQNAKKPPAQRIQQLDESFQQMQQRRHKRGRRRVSSEEDLYQEQQLGGLQRSENQLCARCLKTNLQQTQTCSLCHTVYCKECKPLRGVQQHYSFVCFNCSFLKKQQRQLETNVNRAHFGDIKRSSKVYLPQVDDQVYFFFQGYEEVLSKYHDTLNPKAAEIFEEFQLLAIDALQELKTAPLCRVNDMEYLFPIKPKSRSNARREQQNEEKIKEINVVVQLVTERGLTFQVFYIPGVVQFLVRKQVIEYVINHKQLTKKIVQNNIQTTRSDEEIQIVKVKSTSDRNIATLWRAIEVAHNEEGTRRLRRDINKSSINIWDIASKMPEIPFATLEKSEANKIIESINKVRKMKPELFDLFEEDVNLEDYPHYLLNVEVPMCISTIVSRLKSQYYVSENSVVFDLKVIPKASISFSGAEHQVTLTAEALVSEITKLIHSKSVTHQMTEESSDHMQRVLAQPQRIQSRQSVQEPQREPPVPAARPRERTARNTRANPEPQLQRRNRATRNPRVSYREMEIEYEQSLDNQNPHPRRLTRHSLRH